MSSDDESANILSHQNIESESSDPKFWLVFRTSDDGTGRLARDPIDSTGPGIVAKQTSFPQFVRLPPELRVKIWAELVQPRIIVACCMRRPDCRDEIDSNGNDKARDYRRELERRTTRGASVPALLHVNRESRAVGLEHYELTFSWRISKMLSDTPTSGPAHVYFNFAQDALLLTGELEAFDNYGFNLPMVYFLRREDTHRVRHVACAFRELGYPDQESDMISGCLWHVVDRFPAAKRLLLTVGEGDEEKLGGSMGGARLLSAVLPLLIPAA